MIAENQDIKRQQFAKLLELEAQPHPDRRTYADVTPYRVQLLLDDTLDQTATYWRLSGLTWQDWVVFAPYLDDWSRDDLAQAIIEVLLMRRGHGRSRAERAVDQIKNIQADRLWCDSIGLVASDAEDLVSAKALTAMDAIADKAERWLVEHPELPSTKTKSTVPTSRRGRGRPRDEKFHIYTSERFAELGNVAQVAEEAVAQFGGTPEAARKRIRRSEWYQRIAPAVAPQEHEPAPQFRPATKSDRPSIADAIEKHIQSQGPRTPEEFAVELGLDLRKVDRVLQKNLDRFQYILGNRWGLL